MGEVTTKRAEAPIANQMWVGDTKDLESLFQAALELEAESQRKAIESQVGDKSAIEEEYRKRYSFLDHDKLEESWIEHWAERIADIRRDVSLTATVKTKHYNQTLSGPPLDVLVQIDEPKDVIRVELDLGSTYSYRAPDHGRFHIGMGEYGASGYVVASDTDFIDLAKSKLTSEMIRRRPWYWWMRTLWVPPLIYFFSTFIASGSLLVRNIISPGISWTGVILFYVFIAAYTIFLFVGWNRVIPKFELLRDRRDSAGSRAVLILGGVGAWVAATILIPIIL